jgi:hypothetical protein
MFIGREKELGQLNAELSSWKRSTSTNDRKASHYTVVEEK